MAYQMLIDSAFQTTLEIVHQIFSNFFKRLTHRVNRTVGCSDPTIRKANSKIFENWQTAWTVQTGRTANSPKRPDRPKSWYWYNHYYEILHDFLYLHGFNTKIGYLWWKKTFILEFINTESLNSILKFF